jgi:hypothetical protein
MLGESNTGKVQLFQTPRSRVIVSLRVRHFLRGRVRINSGTVHRIRCYIMKFHRFQILSEGEQKIHIPVLGNPSTVKSLGDFRPIGNNRGSLILYLLFRSLSPVYTSDIAAGCRYSHFLAHASDRKLGEFPFASQSLAYSSNFTLCLGVPFLLILSK